MSSLLFRLKSSLFSARSRTLFCARFSSMTEFSVCLTTVSNEQEAKTLARSIVESNQAACVNVVRGLTSIYRWKSKIEEEEEILLIIKTRKDRVSSLLDLIKSKHSYETPEFIELPIQSGSQDYLNWIDGAVRSDR